jgi:hypothetical protein
MLFKSKVEGMVTKAPVRFKVTKELQRFAIFIPLSLLSLTVFTLLYQPILAQRPAGGLDQAGIHGNAHR